MQGLGEAQSIGTLNALSASQKETAGAQKLMAGQNDSKSEVKKVFQDFVAGTFYGEMMKAMHSTHDKPAYMHGGQAEEFGLRDKSLHPRHPVYPRDPQPMADRQETESYI